MDDTILVAGDAVYIAYANPEGHTKRREYKIESFEGEFAYCINIHSKRKVKKKKNVLIPYYPNRFKM